MAEESPQPRSLMKLVMQLAREVQAVKHVSLVEGGVSARNVKAGAMQAHFEQVSLVEARQVDTDLVCELKYELSGKPAKSGENAPPAVTVSAIFRVVYDCPAKDWAEEDVINGFARINGQLTTHPYWREFVQGSLARCGLPAPPVPPFVASELLKQLDATPKPSANDEAAS